MRGGDNRQFLDTWQLNEVDTDAGRLEYTIFPGPVAFIGCTRLIGVPIGQSQGQHLLDELGHEHAALRFMGDGSIKPTARVPM